MEKEERTSDAYKRLWKDLAAGKPISGEFRRVSKIGKTVWIRGNYTPVFNKNGQVSKIIKLAYDITSLKKS